GIVSGTGECRNRSAFAFSHGTRARVPEKVQNCLQECPNGRLEVNPNKYLLGASRPAVFGVYSPRRMLSLDFQPVLRRWWESHFFEPAPDGGRVLPPTPAQLDGWRAIRNGENTLIAAPTGSGKTLAAFLTSIDQLFREGLEQGGLPDEVRVIY